jgi:hypothetical protein
MKQMSVWGKQSIDYAACLNAVISLFHKYIILIYTDVFLHVFMYAHARLVKVNQDYCYVRQILAWDF